jgi:hypothetical protein
LHGTMRVYCRVGSVAWLSGAREGAMKWVFKDRTDFPLHICIYMMLAVTSERGRRIGECCDVARWE